MKKLDFDEMEDVEGGISCHEVTEVLDLLYDTNYSQLLSILNSGNSLMCYDQNGHYISYWDFVGR